MTKIEWTEQTWNPIVGCSVASRGCKHCYAAPIALRHEANSLAHERKHGTPGPLAHYRGTAKRVNGNAVFTGHLALAPESTLTEPLRRKKPAMYFVNSMSDLFHESMPDRWIMQVWKTMIETPWHTYQVLTKRPKRMRAFVEKWNDLSGEDYEVKLVRGPEATRKAHPSGRGQLFADYLDGLIERSGGKIPDGAAWPTFDWAGGMIGWPGVPGNVWLGVSCEDQQRADERIPDLLATPAAVRFVSAEPLLSAIDMKRWVPTGRKARRGDSEWIEPRFYMTKCEYCGWVGSSELCGGSSTYGDDDVICPSCHRSICGDEIGHLHWVIVGGESGPNARPMHPDWARQIRDQCQAAGVPFFFKQWGHHTPRDQVPESCTDDLVLRNRGRVIHGSYVGAPKWLTGRLLDGREWNEMPETIVCSTHSPRDRGRKVMA